MNPADRHFARAPVARALAAAMLASLVLLASCGKDEKKETARPPAEVTVVTVAPRDTPVSATFVAQTQSSQAVNIQARVSGFLDRRMYVEGSVVKAGQTMFQMDRKPFQAQVDAAAAALQRNQAANEVARANLARTKPLAEQNALSQKDLDDAQGQYEQSAAAVAQSQAQLESAKLDLSYTTISSPVTGVSSFAAVADGTYVDAKNAQLTTVSVLTPMWINFSISENEMERIRNEAKTGQMRLPESRSFIVEIELVDGSIFPHRGKITFTDPSYNPQTGTFLIRASVDNPEGVLRPNQYVRTRLIGAVRPNSILVPQRAVQQGARGHFVWVVNKTGKAEQRPVQVGDWYGESWFISQGLSAGDRVVVDGGIRLAPDAPVKATPYVPRPGSAGTAPLTNAQRVDLTVAR
jgi:membrane fusion protein (multidrug efflux system)